MDKAKRERSANFTLQERDILASLVLKYQNIIENKKSDASTWKNKEAAWTSIQNEFNAISGGPFRSSKILKVKYDGLKRTVRKKCAVLRSELYRTGGGRSTAPPLDNVEEQIKSLITLNTDGLESMYDSDVLPVLTLPQESQDGINVPTIENIIDIPTLATEETEVKINEVNQIHLIEENPVIVIANECDILPSTSAEATQENLSDKTLTQDVNCYVTPTSKKWDASSRKSLKSRKHPALIANVHKKPLDELSQVRLELANLQKGLLEAEIIEKKKDWEFKEKERKWKEEEYKLKLALLKKQLNS